MFISAFNFISTIVKVCYTKFNLDKILNTLSIFINYLPCISNFLKENFLFRNFFIFSAVLLKKSC